MWLHIYFFHYFTYVCMYICIYLFIYLFVLFCHLFIRDIFFSSFLLWLRYNLSTQIYSTVRNGIKSASIAIWRSPVPHSCKFRAASRGSRYYTYTIYIPYYHTTRKKYYKLHTSFILKAYTMLAPYLNKNYTMLRPCLNKIIPCLDHV